MNSQTFATSEVPSLAVTYVDVEAAIDALLMSPTGRQ
jgi:hypothetical protein